MYTKSATYFLNTKMIDFVGNVRIDNAQYIIEGVNIKQNQNTKVAEFLVLQPSPTGLILKTGFTPNGGLQNGNKRSFPE